MQVWYVAASHCMRGMYLQELLEATRQEEESLRRSVEESHESGISKMMMTEGILKVYDTDELSEEEASARQRDLDLHRFDPTSLLSHLLPENKYVVVIVGPTE